MDNFEKLKEMKTLHEFETYALDESLSGHGKLYFSAGACSKSTPRYNEDAFHKYRIRPRVLRDVSEPKIDCKVLNSSVSCPIGISPVGLQVLAHQDAESATAKGCCKEKCVFILSSSASQSIEEVANEAQSLEGIHPVLWMQTYIHKDRSITLDIIKKAESSGFSAIVVTVDSPNGGLWRKMLPDDFFKRVPSLLAILHSLPRNLEDPSVTFEDLKWVIENSKLPVIAKGILSGEDARRVVECGISAIIVSNHGSRLLERVVPTIDVLKEVVDAVSETGTEVYLDGGVRSGSDVFISLALGAKAVFIGRPAIWGLSLGGENGVRKILQILKDELFMTMQVAGFLK
ncbi:2-Hydroxyacid oxidase 1-like isoform X2 [Argiope bruennichi]|uniref:2-Hydroxyacid oxidase 1-like isoform X2 n=1 Tax=Argiope bruennichi TaxID=94029 RepID=UPI002493EDAD|nr:2-Hydroxyacid oxidase 1-like isoform X2 [Argiope bruennichi]